MKTYGLIEFSMSFLSCVFFEKYYYIHNSYNLDQLLEYSNLNSNHLVSVAVFGTIYDVYKKMITMNNRKISFSLFLLNKST